MSSLQKSASFRSRIPVRRTRLPARRCSSPQPTSSTTSNAHKYHRSHYKKQWYDRRCSSSSFSSSDESCDSETPFQQLLRQHHAKHAKPGIVLSKDLGNSTDAMSLDGLLDSVSSGSFSNPSSPRMKRVADPKTTTMSSNELKSSYESLDDYNYALETLKISDNYCEGNKIMKFLGNQSETSELTSTVPLANDSLIKQEQHQLSQHHLNRHQAIDAMAAEADSVNRIAEDSKKQKELSDWYYIKTSPKPKQPSSYERNRTRNYNPHNHQQHHNQYSDNIMKMLRDNKLTTTLPTSQLPPPPSSQPPPTIDDAENDTDKDMSNVNKILTAPVPGPITIMNNVKYSNAVAATQEVMGRTTKMIENFNEKFRNAPADNQLLLTKRLNERQMRKLNSPIFQARREKYHQFNENEIENQQHQLQHHQQRPPLPHYRSNDFIHHYRQQQQQYEQQMQCQPTTPPPPLPLQYSAASTLERSPVPTNKCFNINLRSRNHTSQSTAKQPSSNNNRRNHNFEMNQHPLQKSQSTSHANAPMFFADVTSSSFEHVNNMVDDMVTTSTGMVATTQLSGATAAMGANFYPNCSEKVINGSTNYLKTTNGGATTTTATTTSSMKMYSKEYENLKDAREMDDKYRAAMTRPLPQLPQLPSELNKQIYQTKPQQQHQLATTPSSYHTDCELSGSYVSLECPSPPGPPNCSENRRDPQARLGNCLRTLYTELALKEQIVPPWAQQVAPGALCPAKLEPELRLHTQSHGLNECISVDQLLTAIQTKEGPFLDAPRRVLIECPPWASRSALALRILYSWAKEAPWPQRGQPVALTIFVPIGELKTSFSNYVAKEFIPRGPINPFASGFGGFNAAWTSLAALKGKLLFVLDGYDAPRGATKSRKNKSTPQDLVDLLEGRLFPESRIILISTTSNCSELLPLMQRHVKYEGLTWGRSASLLGGGSWGAPTRLLDTVQSCSHLRQIARTPLGCLAIQSIFETSNGDLPTDEIDVVESVLTSVAANTPQSHVAELGRLALFCLKTKRTSVTAAELRMYCSSTESNILNTLEKAPVFGRSAKRKADFVYTSICPGISEFLAANYLVSLASRPGLLAAEIAGLSVGDEVEADILKVLTFSMGLLNGRAHVLLSKLSPLWLTPQMIFSLALAGGETDANLNALCDLLGISKAPPISPLESKPIWVQIKSAPTELHGWSLALKSANCTLKNLDVLYQIEKNMLIESRSAMDVFLDALARNESVTTLRISSLIENDVRDTEIHHLATCVAKALLKPRLESFELILTLLEEDPPALKLQSVVTAFCRSLIRQPRINSLLLDLGLCTSQLVQICSTLEKCPNVTRLSLPHLRCERGAINALATLLTVRPLSFLALPSCWGARDDPPSSSGVSMGSGSGSSSGNSGLFSSLPRGALVPASSMGRSATLPRQPIEGPPDKRSQDSVISRTWYPTPGCEGGPHNSGTLHDLLLAARDQYSRLHGLDLSKAQLTLEDSMCLGETVRLSNTLHSIKLEGASRLSEILPALLGAGESPSLQMISLNSPRLALEDAAVGMSARALGSCITLRLLSLDGWSFRIENVSTLASVRSFLSLTCVRELSLSNCRLNIPMFKSDTVMSTDAYHCQSVVVLKIAGAQVILSDHVPLRGPQLLPYLNGFANLRELDISAPARSALGSSSSPPLVLDDKCIISFFHNLHIKFSLLNTLKICNWIIHLDDTLKTLKSVGKSLKNSTLSHIKVDGISLLDKAKKTKMEYQLMHTILSSVPALRWMGASLAGMSEDHIVLFGNAISEIRGPELDMRLSDSTIDNAKSMTQSLGLDGKFDIRVSTFGTSTGICIHVEKIGTKSLTRNK